MSSSKAAMMFIRFCIQYSSVAVLYYDYTLTWTREVQHFWLRKFSLSTALYIACRYGMVANVIYTLALAEKLPTLRIAAILACIGRTAIVVVWGARTYAVFNRNKWVLAIFTLFGLTVVGLAILHIPYVACNGNRGTPPAPQLLPIFTVIFEVLAVTFTSARSLKALRIDLGGLSWESQKETLVFLIFQQGLLYFGSVTVLSVGTVILQNVATPGTFIQRLLNAHTLPLSGLMTARFLLHLRDWEYASGPRTETAIVFNHARIKAAEATTTTTMMGTRGFMRSMVNEFGEDPVISAQQRATLVATRPENGGEV